MQSQQKRNLLLYVALAAITVGLFWPMRQHGFVNYDDPLYLTKNHVVQNGLTADGVKWAFGRLVGNGTYWHPLTWLSHMFDWQVFKADAGKHHLMSLLFHTLNVLLLFTLLHRLTNKPWHSALVAALFAWHPLQVDTVAWLAERKNLLSALFGLLAMIAYVAYIGCRKPTERTSSKYFSYATALLCFVLCLMCKPFVTLPCVLLLIDFWPLGRLGQTDSLRTVFPQLFRLVLEKIPFFALSLTSGIITILSHKQLALITEAHRVPLASRLANAAVAYWRYVRKVFYPNDLAVYYPLPDVWPAGLVAGAALFVIGISVLAIWSARKRPYLFTGWFWFLGVLLPFIGLMQVNDQAMADRFAYIPLIGLFVALVWTGSEMLERFGFANNVRSAISSVVLAATLWTTAHQLAHWKNSETLFAHAIEVAESNIAHINYGVALEEYGTGEKLNEAKAQYERALSLVPNSSMAESNLGVVLGKLGQLNEAVPHFLKAIEINPQDADAHSNLGLAFTYLKRSDDAEKELKEALRLKPDHPNARANLANVLFQQGKAEEAAAQYEQALRSQPENADNHNNLGFILLKLKRVAEAKTQFAQAVQLRPNHAQAQYNLARVLKTEGKTAEAIDHFTIATQANPRYAEAHFELALLLKSAGRENEAKGHLEEALRLRPDLQAQAKSQ